MSATEVKSKRKASVKDARPSKKVKSAEKSEKPEKATENPKLKAASDAKKSRKRAADFVEDAAPAVKPVEDNPKPSKKVKISKKVEIVEPVPTSISKKSDKKEKKEKKSKKSEEKALVVAEDSEEIMLPADEDEEEDVAALLAGFSSDESEGEEVAEEGLALDELPEPKLDKKAKKALAKAQKKAADEDVPGTIYVGRIPHGFYEPQMRSYFTQFGQILNLRLSRNKKTGRSKHYAFIQFASTEVADIVARTMNNYLMFGHILKVRLMSPEQVHPDTWKGANKRFKVVPRAMLERKEMERAKGREYWEGKNEKESKKREKKRKAMAEMGYEFEPPTLKKVEDVPMKDADAKDNDAQENGDAVKESGEELVKAIADAAAVVDNVQVEIENVIKEGKKAEKDKRERTKVKISKKAQA